MRVITGSARGRRLKTLDGDSVRPTTDKVKESIFNIVQFEIEGRRVLDMFCGCGQLGIEALSRGAAKAYFVDLSRDSIKVVTENLEHCKLKDDANVFNGDSLSFLKTTREKFDIVFIDPPYKKQLAEKALSLVLNVLNDGGIIVCETDIKEELPEAVGNYTVAKQDTYSKTKLTIYRYNGDDE
jgi:16S rRNA (guanine(966)-N(2))-methyltransferase RsmD